MFQRPWLVGPPYDSHLEPHRQHLRNTFYTDLIKLVKIADRIINPMYGRCDFFDPFQ
jgi:hypothetical protein